jgi:hypothetical protein
MALLIESTGYEVQFFDVLGDLLFHHKGKRLREMLALLWTYTEKSRSNIIAGQAYNHAFRKNRVFGD